MQKNSPFLVYSSVSFGKHIYSDNHHHNQHAEQLHNPQISLVTLVIKHSPQTPCSQPLGATDLFSVPIVLPLPKCNLSYKWTHTVCWLQHF